MSKEDKTINQLLTLMRNAASDLLKSLQDLEKKKAGIKNQPNKDIDRYYEQEKIALLNSRGDVEQVIADMQQCWVQLDRDASSEEVNDLLANVMKPCQDVLPSLLRSYEWTACIAGWELDQALAIWNNKALRSSFYLNKLRASQKSLSDSLSAWVFYNEIVPSSNERDNFSSGKRSVLRSKVDTADKKIKAYLKIKPEESQHFAQEIKKYFGRVDQDLLDSAKNARQEDELADTFLACTKAIELCSEDIRSFSYKDSKMPILLSRLGKYVSFSVAYAFDHLRLGSMSSANSEYLSTWSNRLMSVLLTLVSAYKTQHDATKNIRESIESKGFITHDYLSLMSSDFEHLMQKEQIRGACKVEKLDQLRVAFSKIMSDLQHVNEEEEENRKKQNKKKFWEAIQNEELLFDVPLGDMPNTDDRMLEPNNIDQGEVGSNQSVMLAPSLDEAPIDLPGKPQKPFKPKLCIPTREFVAWALTVGFAVGAASILVGVTLSNPGMTFHAALSANLSLSVGLFLPLLLLSLLSAGFAFVNLSRRHNGWCLSSGSPNHSRRKDVVLS